MGSIPSRRWLPRTVADAALARYVAGDSPSALAIEYGIHEDTIYKLAQKAGIRRAQVPFTAERKANISAALRHSYDARPPYRHPPDCAHCLAVRGVPKPPRSQIHRERLAAALRARRGDPTNYRAAHDRLYRDLGRPGTCVSCGSAAREWALKHDVPAESLRTDERGRHFSIRPVDYEAKCRLCHRRDDNAHRRGHT